MAFDISNPVGTGTDTELLQFVRATIATVLLHGQSWRDGQVEYTAADLGKLRQMESELQSRIAASSASAGSRDNYATRQRAL